MKAPTHQQAGQGSAPAASKAATQKRSLLLPALLAGGACGLAGQSAQAIQLGDIQVQSALGQPLRASIAYALSPNEQIHSYCIFLKPGVAAEGLPALSQARITLSGSRINITGSAPVREPMMALGLMVDCPYSANLTRSYTVLLDPVPATVATAVTNTVQAQRAPVVQNNTPAQAIAVRPAAPRSTANQAALPVSGSYRVRVGDTLSGIASRIENRPVGLWPAVGAIFDANPDAFIDGDINRLKAGSLLVLPSFDGLTAATVDATVSSTAEQQASDAAASTVPVAQDTTNATGAYEGVNLAAPAESPATAPATQTTAAAAADLSTELVIDSVAETAVPATAITDETGAPAAAAPVLDQTGDLRPGDVQIANDQAFVSPINAGAEAAADTTASTPEAPAVTIDATGEGNPQLLYWLGGAGLALILGFVAFRSRSRFAAPAAPADATTGADTAQPNNVADAADARAKATPEIDFDIGVQADTQRQLVLDADLTEGTGLNEGAEVELAEDFGFSTTRDLQASVDLDLTDDSNLSGATITGERPNTDIIPAHRFAEESILEHEILPGDDEYDLSMIVDATKQEFSDGDVTAKDLMAIAVTQEMPELGSEADEYTLSKEVDYKVLEQDYEEELTATQALNAEVVRAATELANTLGEAEGDTARLAAADDSLSITAVQENNTPNDDYDDDDEETEILTDLDDTGINEALVEDTQEFTAEMPLRRSTDDPAARHSSQSLESTFEGTAELPARHADVHDLTAETTANAELTEELPAAENDPTLEMDVESGRFRTKKLVG